MLVSPQGRHDLRVCDELSDELLCATKLPRGIQSVDVEQLSPRCYRKQLVLVVQTFLTFRRETYLGFESDLVRENRLLNLPVLVVAGEVRDSESENLLGGLRELYCPNCQIQVYRFWRDNVSELLLEEVHAFLGAKGWHCEEISRVGAISEEFHDDTRHYFGT